MNYKCITYILGWILKVEGVFLALPLAVSLLYRERTWPVFLACALLSLVLGTALSFKRPENFQFYAREGYVGVALGWIVMSLERCLFILQEKSPALPIPCSRLYPVLPLPERVFCPGWRIFPTAF